MSILFYRESVSDMLQQREICYHTHTKNYLRIDTLLNRSEPV